ncbi:MULTISPECIES: acyl-CoA thioesterase II [Vibrio]|uniref:Acyl-CoA thioesterase 2 n=1 Tax=Vibrio algicola TaxID=2662262 RepID=A0A5Q0TCS9_9VIBR|nr:MULTISPECIES: acyl-CoA thioesterase II [Vibrio]MBD1577494.1 acyl-CoA thioesterase II [Vibrio sp. S11_S32]
MSNQLQELLNLHQLEQLDVGLFRGQCENLGLPQVYGGQVIGQALSAAAETVAKDRYVHSFHSYFLHPGDINHPIIYDVETLRDGRSLSTRRVKAVQHGRPIFYLTASYQAPTEGLEHQQVIMPEVEGPEGLPSETDLAKDLLKHLPESIQRTFCSEKPIEVRPVIMNNPMQPSTLPGKQYLWIKANGKLSDNPDIHQYLLSYASDWGFLVTALFPHGVSLLTPKFQVATIDHSMWFHRPFRMDEWLLYSIDSPTSSNTRGLVRGEIYDQQGHLVATAVQEGVMRFRD